METTHRQTGQKAPSPVLGGVVPYLQVEGAMKAAEFYGRALGASLEDFHPVDEKGRTMHVHLYVNGGSVMLNDPYPDYGQPFVQPAGFTVLLPVTDIDMWWKRAVDAGMEVVMDLQVMFWGDRYGQLRDPFGVAWSMNEPVTS